MSRRKKVSGEQLKRMRQKAGYTQEILALRIGISRETVSAIENEKPETMNGLPADWLRLWYKVTHLHLDEVERNSFKNLIMEFFGF